MKELFFFFCLFLFAVSFTAEGCKEGNKAVGVCLHVYLERDFLSLEKIVYPTSARRYGRSIAEQTAAEYKQGVKYDQNTTLINHLAKPEKYVISSYRDRDWIEGPELEDHCKRLKGVVTCFEEELLNCDNAYHFFRYRHLLFALSEAQQFLCASAHTRKERFLRFLKTIECVEEARRQEQTCHRHNVSSIIWNKILRLEVGEEICHALNTQRACLLQHNYIYSHCQRDERRVKIYSDLSSYFLSIWCKLPVHPKLVEAARESMTYAFNAAIVTSTNLHYSMIYAFIVCVIAFLI